MASERQCKGSNTIPVRSLILNEERMRSLGHFPFVLNVFGVLTFLGDWQVGHLTHHQTFATYPIGFFYNIWSKKTEEEVVKLMFMKNSWKTGINGGEGGLSVMLFRTDYHAVCLTRTSELCNFPFSCECICIFE